MKRKYLYIVATLLLTSFTSCNDSFLDRYPQEELSDGSFWKTPKDAETFVSQIYNVLPGGGAGDIDGDIDSDNAVHGIKWAAGNVSKGIYDPADFSWSWEYSYIRKCNVLLQKIELIQDYDVTKKEQVIGQARFLRGYTYFSLIQKFGDVPYTDSPLELKDLEKYYTQ